MTQAHAPIEIQANASNVLLDEDGLLRLGSLVGALTQGHSSVALASSDVALLQHHAQALTQALREQAQTQLTIQALTDLNGLLEQFNGLVARLPVRDARKPPQANAVTHVWLMQSAEQYPQEALQALQRLVHDFPAVKLQLAFIHYGEVSRSPLSQWPNLWCWPITSLGAAQAERLRARAAKLDLGTAFDTWLARCRVQAPSPSDTPAPPVAPSSVKVRHPWRALGVTLMIVVAVLGAGAWFTTPAPPTTPAVTLVTTPSLAVTRNMEPAERAPQHDEPMRAKAAPADDVTEQVAAPPPKNQDLFTTPVASKAKPLTQVSPPPPQVVSAPQVAQRLAIAVLAAPAKPAGPDTQAAPPTKVKQALPELRALNDHATNKSSTRIAGVSTQVQEPSSFNTPLDLNITARDDSLLPSVATPELDATTANDAWIQALPDERWLIEHTRQASREAAALWAGSHPGLEHARLVTLPEHGKQPRYALITGPFVDQAAARRYAAQIQNAVAPVFLLGADLKRQVEVLP